jgi:hypothetical protein
MHKPVGNFDEKFPTEVVAARRLMPGDAITPRAKHQTTHFAFGCGLVRLRFRLASSYLNAY